MCVHNPQLRALSVASGLLCRPNFVVVCLTFLQFILKLKICLYTIVPLLLEEFKISLQSSLVHNQYVTR